MSPITMAWLFLIGSILTEVMGMITLKYTNGFTLLLPSALAVCFILASLWMISLSLKHLELGITYAVWAGSSSAILALIGISFYAESITLIKTIGVIMTIFGVILLNLGSN
jgi:small multidrug resistance pump